MRTEEKTVYTKTYKANIVHTSPNPSHQAFTALNGSRHSENGTDRAQPTVHAPSPHLHCFLSLSILGNGGTGGGVKNPLAVIPCASTPAPILLLFPIVLPALPIEILPFLHVPPCFSPFSILIVDFALETEAPNAGEEGE